MIGTLFGTYRVETLLGRGGMGEVYRAVDTSQDEREVALKVLTPALSEDPEFAARFRREAEIAASLTDPHIVPIHRYGEIDGRLFLDMQLIDGQELSAVLARAGALDPERAVAIVEQVGSALDVAHADGLVHRDVKPSNILLTDPGGRRPEFAYLLDFGIARPTEPGSRTALTRTGAVIGTLAYMAPERFLAQPATPASDVYSLACVLHELLTGARPYPGTGYPVQVAGHLHQPPPRPSALRPGLPGALDAVVARGMAKDPAARYPTADDLAHAARAALAGAGPDEVGALPAPQATALDPLVSPTWVPTSESPRTPPVPPPLPRSTGGPRGAAPPVPRGRWIVATWVAAVVLVVAALATVLVVVSPEPDSGDTADSGATGIDAPAPSDAMPSGGPVTERTLIGQAPSIESLVIADLDGIPVLVAPQSTETRVFDLATGAAIGESARDFVGASSATATRLDGRSVVVTGGADSVIRLYDLVTGQPLATTLTGHTGFVHALAVADVDGRKVLLSAASDNTIRRWDLASAAPIGEPIAGPAEINAMSVIRLAGRPVVLVKGVDTIRAWDVADGTPVGAPIAGSRSILSPLTTVEVSGTTAVLTEGYLETGVVDLHTGAALDGYLTESVSLVATAVVVAGRPLLVEPGDGDDDKLIRLRDLRDGRPVGSPLAGHEDGIRSLQTVTVDGSPFLISTSYDNSIRIWDLTARSQG